METGSLHTPGAKPCQPPSAVDKGRGKQPSARLQNPLDLPEHAIRLRQDVQGIGDDHRVEGLRRVGQMGGILDREVETGGTDPLFRLLDHSGSGVRGLPEPDIGRERKGQLPRAAGQLQHVHIPGEMGPDPLTHRRVQRCGAVHGPGIMPGSLLPKSQFRFLHGAMPLLRLVSANHKILQPAKDCKSPRGANVLRETSR